MFPYSSSLTGLTTTKGSGSVLFFSSVYPHSWWQISTGNISFVDSSIGQRGTRKWEVTIFLLTKKWISREKSEVAAVWQSCISKGCASEEGAQKWRPFYLGVRLGEGREQRSPTDGEKLHRQCFKWWYSGRKQQEKSTSRSPVLDWKNSVWEGLLPCTLSDLVPSDGPSVHHCWQLCSCPSFMYPWAESKLMILCCKSYWVF